jgi:hypothetical protein
MKTFLALCTALASLSLSSVATANTLTPIRDLVANPQTYDRQTITIAGTITSVLQMREPDGAADAPYDMLVVCDGRSCVLARLGNGNFPDLRGAFVNVRGTFRAARRIGPEFIPQELGADVFTLSQLHAHREGAAE